MLLINNLKYQWLEITTHFFHTAYSMLGSRRALLIVVTQRLDLQKLWSQCGFPHSLLQKKENGTKLCTVIKAFMEVICHVFQILLANACHKATSNF